MEVGTHFYIFVKVKLFYMNKWLIFLVCVAFSMFGKIVNIDDELERMYNNQDYKSCYELSKCVNLNNFDNTYLSKFNIKISKRDNISTHNSKLYQFKCLKKIDINCFYYSYINNKTFYDSNFVNIKEEFYSWSSNYFNSSIKEYHSDKEIQTKLKLYEIYNFISNKSIRDSIFLNKNIRNVYIDKVKRLNIKTIELSNIDINYASSIIDNMLNNTRFVHIDQIQDFFFKDLNEKEKIVMIYIFTQRFLNYAKFQKYSANNSNIKQIILYRTCVCEGYSNLYNTLMRLNNFNVYKTIIETTEKNPSQYNLNALHENNILIYQHNIYYIDVTWNRYYIDFNNKEKIKDINKFILGDINDLSYIIEIPDYNKSTIIEHIKKIRVGN